MIRFPCFVFNSVVASARQVRSLGLLLLACAGCNPGIESNQPTPTAESTAGQVGKVVPTNTLSADEQQHLTRLLTVIRERLELMPGVAQAKWNRKLPITDAKREASLLDALQAKGVERGLPAEFVREFFQAQITASKLIQEQLFTDWTAHQQPPFMQPPDLEREIRPKIDKLNEQLLEALTLVWSERSRSGLKEMVDRSVSAEFESRQKSTHPWPTDVVKTALKPIREISEFRTQTPSR